MSEFLQHTRIEIERTGHQVTVPNNDFARLMYYLNCVCVSIDCNHDPDIQRFTSYNNWASLSIEEQKALIVVCYAFSPDVLDDKVFFHSDRLCGNSNNEFYTINQVRNQVLAAESIVIAGQIRTVNKIMTYKLQWMKTYYLEPMQRLVARIGGSSQRPALTYTPPVITQRSRTTTTTSHKSRWICCCVVIIIIIVIIISSTVNRN